jgi:hypothetical protein
VLAAVKVTMIVDKETAQIRRPSERHFAGVRFGLDGRSTVAIILSRKTRLLVLWWRLK